MNAPNAFSRRPKIMLVDDDALMTDLMHAWLEEHGYFDVVVSNDPGEAYARVKAERPAALVLDLLMPGFSGFEILSAIRADEQLKDLVVIVLTAAAGEANVARALELGASEVIAKPIVATQLTARLDAHLQPFGRAAPVGAPPPAA